MPLLCYTKSKAVITLRWSDKFKRGFDLVYELVKNEFSDIRFPCYGGRFWFRYGNYRFDTCYLYLTPTSIIYTYSGGYRYEIMLNEITKATVKKGFLIKNHYHIRFRADRNYHFLIYDMKDFATDLTGVSSENVRNFIDTLKMKVNIE